MSSSPGLVMDLDEAEWRILYGELLEEQGSGAGVSGNDIWEFGNGNRNGLFRSRISGRGRELKKTHSLNSGTGRE